MRRDQSTTGSDYRREHNQEMWDRKGLPPVEVPLSRAAYNYHTRLKLAERTFEEESKPYRRGFCPVSRAAVEAQGIGE